jgi:hypothetical protein
MGVATPDFEVKLSLDPASVLDIEFEPTRKVERELELEGSNRKIATLFVDSRPFNLHSESWNVRIRRFEDEKKLEVSYKRRSPLGSATLADALTAAAEQGFDSREDDYDAQVEWGYARRTLSFTRKKELKAEGGDLLLPATDEARRTVVEDIPGRLDRWKQEGWARSILENGHVYGPVLGRRWTGNWKGPKLAFEVWLIRTESGVGYEPVVELSFKQDEEEKAAKWRDELMAFTRERGLLLEHDVLKTEMILKRY